MAAGGAPAKVANAAPGGATGSRSGSGGVLMLAVAATSSTDNVVGRKLWVLKTDPQFALINAGLGPTPYGTPLQNWMRACDKKDQACIKGMQALQPYSVGIATADATGHAQTPPLAAGRCWVVSDAKVDHKHVMWSQPVDVKRRRGGRHSRRAQRHAGRLNEIWPASAPSSRRRFAVIARTCTTF